MHSHKHILTLLTQENVAVPSTDGWVTVDLVGDIYFSETEPRYENDQSFWTMQDSSGLRLVKGRSSEPLWRNLKATSAQLRELKQAITRSVLKRVKDAQGGRKLEDLPEDYKFFAVDEDGGVCAYSEKPFVSGETATYWVDTKGHNAGLQTGEKFTVDWRLMMASREELAEVEGEEGSEEEPRELKEGDRVFLINEKEYGVVGQVSLKEITYPVSVLLDNGEHRSFTRKDQVSELAFAPDKEAKPTHTTVGTCEDALQVCVEQGGKTARELAEKITELEKGKRSQVLLLDAKVAEIAQLREDNLSLRGYNTALKKEVEWLKRTSSNLRTANEIEEGEQQDAMNRELESLRLKLHNTTVQNDARGRLLKAKDEEIEKLLLESQGLAIQVSGQAIPRHLVERLEYLGLLVPENWEKNEGNSNYATKTIQPWSVWLDYPELTTWDHDIIKRVLRTKKGEARELDYKKIIHVANERLRQLSHEG